METLYTTKGWFPGREPISGKVREAYLLDSNFQRLVITTDRISAYDVVASEPVPDKGRVLNEMSLFWFALTGDIIENHLISSDVERLPLVLSPYRDRLIGRIMFVKNAEVVPIEWVVRGYLAGSGLKEYNENQSICGVPLPAGLQEGDRLPGPILTPATKAVDGHDENITASQARELVGVDTFVILGSASIELYKRAAKHAFERGIIIADTKFEFGWYEGRLILVDEMLTPDSSRFWPVDDWVPGRLQKSFDKQPVRDYLEGLGWNKQPPMPPLPPEVKATTTVRYQEALRLITGLA